MIISPLVLMDDVIYIGGGIPCRFVFLRLVVSNYVSWRNVDNIILSPIITAIRELLYN